MSHNFITYLSMYHVCGVGWPSFSDVADKGNVARIVDSSFGMTRTEVVCAKV